jgi:pimeloyl-ACP methyl ester carboxylesterase
MAQATSTDGVRIHYEVEGDGPPMLLQHGFSGSLLGWRDAGYVDALRDSHRLILMDGRGHGQSEKPHDVESYAMQRRVDDALAVLDAEGVERSSYWGYSMGGRIGFGMLKLAPDRLTAAVLGGMHPYERERSQYETRIESLSRGMEAFIAEREAQTGSRTPEPRRSQLLENDSEALVAATRSNLRRDSLDDSLSAISTPTLIFCGTADQYHDGARRAAGEIPGAEFLALDGLDHWQAMQRSDLVLPQATDFLARAAERTPV